MRAAVILGGGPDVHNEMQLVCMELQTLNVPFELIGANEAALHYNATMCTLHPKRFALKSKKPVISYVQVEGVTEVMSSKWPRGTNSGSSGLYAVKYAMELGHQNIILCGVPMIPAKNTFHDRFWSECDMFTDTWKRNLGLLYGKVWSASGWTKEVLNFNLSLEEFIFGRENP